MDEGQPILLTYLKDLDLLPVAVFEYLPQQHGSPQQSLWGLRHFIRASLTQRDLFPSVLFTGCRSTMFMSPKPNTRITFCIPNKEELQPLRQSSLKELGNRTIRASCCQNSETLALSKPELLGKWKHAGGATPGELSSRAFLRLTVDTTQWQS